MILVLFILGFIAIHHWTRDLVVDSKVYAVRMILSCLVLYVLVTQIGVLL